MSADMISLNVPEGVQSTIREIAQDTGRSVDEVAGELLTEAIKMRRVPGIVFADGPTGRRARIAGTGIEVFEVIRVFRAVGNDRKALRDAFHWLSDAQLQAALNYSECYGSDIDECLRDDVREQDLLENLWGTYPATRPRS